jgi:tetratricopeptide (TPR) repeat protein
MKAKRISRMKGISGRAVFLILAQAAALLGMPQAFSQDARVKSAMRLLEIEKPGKAIELMRQTIKTEPNTSSLYYYLGYIQLRTGDVEKANQSFDMGIALNEKEAIHYAGKGEVLLLKNNPAEAKALFDRAIVLSKSKDVQTLQAVARAYLDNGKFANEALMLLEDARKLDNVNPETYLLLGDARVQLKIAGTAISNYESAAQYDAVNAQPSYKIGLIYIQNREYQMAEESFQRAISLDAQYTPAYRELGELFYARKNGQEAVKYYETYLSLTETPEKGQQRYAFFLLMAKDYAKANEVFSVLAGKPDVSPLTLRYYSLSLYESGNYALSRKYFEEYFTKMTSGDAEASDYEVYGRVLLRLNQDSLAQVSFQKSLAMNRNQPILLQLQAETYFKRKKYTETLQAYQQLERRGYKLLAQDYYAKGLSHYFNKQYLSADSAFLKLIELQPDMSVGYLWEARTKSNLDPETEGGWAKPYYERVIEKDKANPDKNRKDLIEAYSYLGYFHYLKKEMKVSKSYWQKVLDLDPKDPRAQEAVKQIR